MKYHITRILALTLSSLAIAGGLRAAPPTPADVGEAESFGHNVQYMGAKSGFITLSPACTPAPTPIPPATANDDQCFTLTPAPARLIVPAVTTSRSCQFPYCRQFPYLSCK